MTDRVEGLVRRFYEEAWNRWDDRVVDALLAEDFVFRGSLGDETRGRDGWRAYRDTIRRAVPDFHNEIVDLFPRPRPGRRPPPVQRPPPGPSPRPSGPGPGHRLRRCRLLPRRRRPAHRRLWVPGTSRVRRQIQS